MNGSQTTSGFVTAGNIRLHYLDWGGTGTALLFLAGMGCSAHIFGSFAPRFTARFHVIGLDRRGHGDSDYPDDGYDPDTLSEDLRQFLDALHIERIILAGHSMACLELCHFTVLHPERVLKLVFLDAAYDDSKPEQQAIWDSNPAPRMWPKWPATEPTGIDAYAAAIQRSLPSLAAIWGPEMLEDFCHNVKTTADGRVVDKMSAAQTTAIRRSLRTYTPEFSSLRLPVLSFFCTQDPHDYLSPESMSEDQQQAVVEYYQTKRQPYILQWAERFKQMVPHARVVVIPEGHHYCFIKQAGVVFEEMMAFLSEEPATSQL